MSLPCKHKGNCSVNFNKRPYTIKQFIEAVENSRNYGEVLEKLGKDKLKDTTNIKTAIKHLKLDTSHWNIDNCTYNLEELTNAIEKSYSWTEVAKTLGIKIRNSNKFKLQANKYNIDISHMFDIKKENWRSFAKRNGLELKPFSQYKRSNKKRKSHRRPIKSLLIVGKEKITSGHHLKLRLIEENFLKEQCNWCGINNWRNEPLSLHLDHINGDRRDNRLENLRLLCPNCHSQTPTYCGRNNKKSNPG